MKPTEVCPESISFTTTSEGEISRVDGRTAPVSEGKHDREGCNSELLDDDDDGDFNLTPVRAALGPLCRLT